MGKVSCWGNGNGGHRRDCYAPVKKIAGKTGQAEIVVRRKGRFVHTPVTRQHPQDGSYAQHPGVLPVCSHHKTRASSDANWVPSVSLGILDNGIAPE